MRRVSTANAPQPAGHYSQATVHNGTVYVAGQLPIIPETGDMVTGSIQEQTTQALRNVRAILEAAGSGLEGVLKVTVYVSNIDLWGGVNEAYSEFFGEHKPARAVVPTRELHHDAQVEIEAIAAVLD